MVRRRWEPTDDELARDLRDLAERITYPQAPDLAQTVRARLTADAAPSRRTRPRRFAGPRRRVALTLVAAVLLLGGALTLSPAARTAVAQWLPRGIVFFPPRDLPHVPATLPAGAGLRLGRRVTLADARARLPFRVLVPASLLGPPDEVYVRSAADSSGGATTGEQGTGDDTVTLVYRARHGLPAARATGVGLLLTEARGTSLGGKFIDRGTRLEWVTVGGLPGYWLTGRPHLFVYLDAAGMIRRDTLRLAGNVLIWDQGGLALRLETALPGDAAVHIAAGLR